MLVTPGFQSHPVHTKVERLLLDFDSLIGGYGYELLVADQPELKVDRSNIGHLNVLPSVVTALGNVSNIAGGCS